MMKQLLSKNQVTVLVGLARQRAELMQALREIAEAEQEQLQMLVAHYDLPKDKKYVFLPEDDKVYIAEKEEQDKEQGE